jgi:hypothetical protein
VPRAILTAMRRLIVLTVLLLAGFLLPPAGRTTAVELSVSHYSTPTVVSPHPPIWRYNLPNQRPPFTRSGRAQAVWDSNACWNECGANCTWNLNACLYKDTQGYCLVYTDACDRNCQRTCRTQGGPFLPFD